MTAWLRAHLTARRAAILWGVLAVTRLVLGMAGFDRWDSLHVAVLCAVIASLYLEVDFLRGKVHRLQEQTGASDA